MNKAFNYKKIFFAVFFLLLTVMMWQVFLKTSQQGSSINLSVPKVSMNDFMQEKTLELQALEGKPYILHFWATWCGVCLKEHNNWVNLTNNNSIPVVGVNFHDDPVQARKFLLRKGNPYIHSISDNEGLLGVRLGLKGTPETFVVNDIGNIVYRHTGPVNEKILENNILPVINNMSNS
jgi:cytochrome c biogenesis protein CcmG/thiol:disulfide interchange protein DsbE